MANVFGTLLKIDNNLTLRYKYGKNFTNTIWWCKW